MFDGVGDDEGVRRRLCVGAAHQLIRLNSPATCGAVGEDRRRWRCRGRRSMPVGPPSETSDAGEDAVYFLVVGFEHRSSELGRCSATTIIDGHLNRNVRTHNGVIPMHWSLKWMNN